MAIASNDSMEGKLFQIYHKLHGVVGPVAVVSAGSIDYSKASIMRYALV